VVASNRRARSPIWVSTVSIVHLGVDGLDIETVDNQKVVRRG
jgi:hypothetical protein